MTDTTDYPIDINPSIPLETGLRSLATLTADWTLGLVEEHREAIRQWTNDAWPSVARCLPDELNTSKNSLIHSVTPLHRHEDGTESGEIYLLLTTDNRERVAAILLDAFGHDGDVLDFSVNPSVAATWDVPLPLTCDDGKCSCHLPWDEPDLLFDGSEFFDS